MFAANGAWLAVQVIAHYVARWPWAIDFDAALTRLWAIPLLA